MDSKSPSSSSTASSGQSLKRKDAPGSTDSVNKKSHTIIDCPIASDIFRELGCSTDFLNSGKVLAWALDPTDPAFENIHTYVERSQGHYSDVFDEEYEVKILSILRIMTSANSLQNAAIQVDHDDDPKNKGQLRKMLRQGTASNNVPPILQNGLKLPKRNSPDPYFGDGIYFSDNSSYSLEYCSDLGEFRDKEGRYVGYIFLSDVRLGNIHKTYNLEPTAPEVQISKPKPQGGGLMTVTETVDSIQGCGQTTPDPKEDQMIEGCTWPLGKIINDDKAPLHSELVSSEFVIYEPKRVIPKFLIKVELLYS